MASTGPKLADVTPPRPVTPAPAATMSPLVSLPPSFQKTQTELGKPALPGPVTTVGWSVSRSGPNSRASGRKVLPPSVLRTTLAGELLTGDRYDRNRLPK